MKTDTQKDAAISFLRMAATGRVDEAYDKYISRDFKHHNAYFAGDRESLKRAMADAHRENPKTAIDVKQAIQDGDMVAVFSHVRQKPDDIGIAVVHICRFELDKIVEMWDIGMRIPPDSPNVNGVV